MKRHGPCMAHQLCPSRRRSAAPFLFALAAVLAVVSAIMLAR